MNGKTTANHSAAEAAIRDLFRALLDDRGRSNAFGSRFTEDAGHVAFDGSHTRGRGTGEVYDVRFLAPDVAHAVAGAAMRGKSKPLPGRDSIQTFVAVRQGEEWRLAAQFGLHNLGADLPHTAFTGTGHWLRMDRPEEFDRILDEFLAQVRATGARQSREPRK